VLLLEGRLQEAHHLEDLPRGVQYLVVRCLVGRLLELRLPEDRHLEGHRSEGRHLGDLPMEDHHSGDHHLGLRLEVQQLGLLLQDELWALH
jgi:hypothetical protein